MYISNQVRGGNMDQFFSHETLKYPAALTKCGEMRCIIPSPNKSPVPKVEAAALEGSVLVNMIKPKKNQTFV